MLSVRSHLIRMAVYGWLVVPNQERHGIVPTSPTGKQSQADTEAIPLLRRARLHKLLQISRHALRV